MSSKIKSVQGIIIGVDGSVTDATFKRDENEGELADLQKAVDGSVEHMALYVDSQHVADMWVNGVGRMEQKPNTLARCIADETCERYDTQHIYGNVVVLGQSNAHGYTTSIKPDVREFIYGIATNQEKKIQWVEKCLARPPFCRPAAPENCIVIDMNKILGRDGYKR